MENLEVSDFFYTSEVNLEDRQHSEKYKNICFFAQFALSLQAEDILLSIRLRSE